MLVTPGSESRLTTLPIRYQKKSRVNYIATTTYGYILCMEIKLQCTSGPFKQ